MKTIQIKDIKIYETTFADNTISVVYSLLDEDGKEFDKKRTTIKLTTTSQKSKLSAINTLVGTILKNKEKL